MPITRRLGLGSVLGFLLAGVAIGPWGVALVAAPQAILQFAEFGVVLLLFLVGLELDPRRLWALRRSIFGLGGAQVLLTLAAVTAIGWALGAPLKVALVAGMGFAMSSTAIGMQTLAEKNLLPTPGGQASFAVLLFQDLAVIPLMIVLGLLTAGRGGVTAFDWLAALKAIGMIAAVVGGRTLLRPVLRWIAGTGLREVFVGFALFLVLGIAALMQLVGLSMALGAFLAGVLLADSEYRHELEVDIEPFKGLLLGLFFMAIGMSVDLGLFLRSPLLVLGLALGVVALKLVLLFALARPFSGGSADASLFAVALSQVGEFAFVLFTAAGGLLARTTLDVLTAAVAVSMLTTPFLMALFERFVAPRFERARPREADLIDERNPVIVAGFGRFGQVVARVLRGLGIGATVIDHDPNQIELVRRFGWKAYYGDATRADLLEAAGAARARLLVIAVDEPDAAMQIVRLARERYPGLQLLARARSRSDAFALVDLGVPAVRETFGSALDAAEAALGMLGFGAHAAHRISLQFRRHDESLLAKLAAHRKDVKQLIALSERGRKDLAQLLAGEAGVRHEPPAAEWK